MEIVTESRLKEIFLKKVSDPFWGKIHFVQYFFGVFIGEVNKTMIDKFNRRNKETLKVEYDREKLQPLTDDLLKRALAIMEIIKGYVSKASEKFISAKEELEFQNSLRTSPNLLAKYLTYKLAVVYEKETSIQIIRMTTEFVVTPSEAPNSYNLFWMNAYDLKYKPVLKFSANTYYKRGEIAEIFLKSFRRKKFSEEGSKAYLQNSPVCKEYLRIMEENYDSIKKKIFEKKEKSVDNAKERPNTRKKTKKLTRKIQTLILDQNHKSFLVPKKADSGSAKIILPKISRIV